MVRNFLSTNWETFAGSLPILNLGEINCTLDLEREATKLLNNVKSAFEWACPLRKAFPRKQCKWWSRDLSNVLRKKNLTARQARRYLGTSRGTRANLRKLGLGKLFRKLALERKNQSWVDFISNLKSPRNISALLRSLREKKLSAMPLLCSGESNEKENLEIIRRTHFRESVVNFSVNTGNKDPALHPLPRDLDVFSL